MNKNTIELKRLIKKLFKSRRYFSEQYYIENYVNYDEKDLSNFFQTFLGHIKRSSTPIDVIDKYLNFLYCSDEFLKSEEVRVNNIYNTEFDDNFNKKMRAVSKAISERLEEKIE